MSVDFDFPNLGLYTGFIFLGPEEEQHKSEGFHEFQGEVSPITQIVRKRIVKMLKEPVEPITVGF